MAKRRSASKVRPSRDASRGKAASGRLLGALTDRTDDPVASPVPETLEDAIEEERARLMRAHSILGCVTLAMEGDDGANVARPYYPDLIELARDLVNESINGLDSDKLERLPGERRSR